MFAAIFQIYNLAKMIMSIIGMVRNVMNEYEDKKAEEHRAALDVALDKLQGAKSDEEKRSAIRDIARNSG